jgi:hypothetical protein
MVIDEKAAEIAARKAAGIDLVAHTEAVNAEVAARLASNNQWGLEHRGWKGNPSPKVRKGLSGQSEE